PRPPPTSRSRRSETSQWPSCATLRPSWSSRFPGSSVIPPPSPPSLSPVSSSAAPSSAPTRRASCSSPPSRPSTASPFSRCRRPRPTGPSRSTRPCRPSFRRPTASTPSSCISRRRPAQPSTAPTAVALSNDRAIVSISDGPSSTYGLYMVLMPSLEVRPYVLASPPIAVGIAAGAGRGYVAQDYSEGRITFVDLSEGVPPDGGGGFTARTITGFELSAGIVVGPDQ